MKTFALGDVHGSFKALLQVFERSGFNYEEDELIVLGDVCDGWPQVKECFDELLKVKKLIYIAGNHDMWFLRWATHNWQDSIWTTQGGKNTMKSYGWFYEDVPKDHIELLENSNLYHVDEENRLFVHGGIIPYQKLEETHHDIFLWDRSLIQQAYQLHVHSSGDSQIRIEPNFKEIFIGHTTTQWWKEDCTPVCYSGVWDLDTGAGWSGELTIMDVNTHEYWQSDNVKELYKGIKGRT